LIAVDDPLDFEEDRRDAPARGERLVVDLDGYEGPLDVLLALARDQKVDLARISILQLVDQYIAFIETARALRLEVAADYLVMAAWLAYLKSRLLLPEAPAEDEPSGEALAAALAHQLRLLEAMRDAGLRLMARPLLGRDVFARGAPEGVRVVARREIDLSLYDLLSAYAGQQRRTRGETMAIRPSALYSIDRALKRLRRLVGATPGWRTLASYLPVGFGDPLIRRSSLAATFVASLELAREGKLKLRQAETFAPLYLRAVEGDR